MFQSGELAELQDQVNQQKLQIDMLTNLANTKREENKELTMSVTSLKMQLGWKEREITNLKKKVEIVSALLFKFAIQLYQSPKCTERSELVKWGEQVEEKR